MKKKPNILILIIVLIAIVLIIAGIFLIKFELNKKEKVESPIELSKEEEIIFNNEILNYIYTIDSNMNKDYPIDDFQNIDDNKKTKLVLDILSAPNKEIEVKEIEKSVKNTLII